MAKNDLQKAGGASTVLSQVFTPVKLLVYVAVVVFVGTGVLWWQKVYMSEDQVFWGMVSNNLRTASFTQTSEQSDQSQTINQVTQIQTSPTRLANSETTITQGGAHAVTEGIGTPVNDYTRYVELSVSQKNAQGKPVDFSSIKNVWGKSVTQDATTTNGQLYGQSVMSVIPFGDLTAQQRDALISNMHRSQVYVASRTSVEHENGRPVYDYDVVVKAASYISVLKEFGKAYGLNQLATIDPTQYQSASDVTVQVKIDAWSHQLREISYGKGARVEKFSAFGSLKHLQTPPADKDTISADELQYRLQMLLQPQQSQTQATTTQG